MNRSAWIAIGIGIAVAVYAGSVLRSTEPAVTNFEECVAAGNPVGESYPRQCWTEDGKRFLEDVAPPGQTGEEPVFCTLDAMQCPDGSYVGRVPPTCEFAPCPGE